MKRDKAKAEQTNKKGFNMKPLSKKKRIIFSAAWSIVAISAIGVAFYFDQKQQQEPAVASYDAVTIKNADDLIFNGSVAAQNVEEFYFDQTKGEVSDILVTNNQEISAETVVLVYQNETVQDQITEQQQTLDKLTLAVNNAQENLDNTYAKKQNIQNSLNEAFNTFNNADEDSMEGQTIRQEEQAKMDQYKEAIYSQEEVISQAQQALDSANLDLSTSTQNMELAQNKITTNVAATTDGTAIVEPKGKTNASVPVIRILGKDTIIKALVSEYDYRYLTKDQAVEIQLLNSNKKIAGTITEISPLPESAATDGTATAQSNLANYSFEVKPSENLQYGYSCQINVPVNELRIPEKAILNEDGKQYAFVYSKGTVKKQAILAENREGVFVVTEGLKEKDRIISNPSQDLKDGQEVMVN
ncbi:efflux RND transporter periplasmic adaptor subunit [Trichococcus alkaliphilus]|uniref:efflux RND transporter periplasmic adaptor subunit n=1 Tax=Trichococcus alkaliphilus TaxID=2052943 RepID=UPI000D0B7B05|nr:HlyD family efflux transporter periplasmic adaptor subunit [Trichococcus alkaliphilus]